MPRLSEFRNTLAIAMWDFTYIETHVKGGAFEDYDKCLDELIERGYNAVRIDAFPHLVAKDLYGDVEEDFVKKAGNEGAHHFGFSLWGRKWTVGISPRRSLVEFIKKCEARGVWVGLSTWMTDVEEKRCEQVQEAQGLLRIWDETLEFLRENDCLGNIIYVDLLNEYPLWNGYTWLTTSLTTIRHPKLPDCHFNHQQQRLYWDTINTVLSGLKAKWPMLDILASQCENHWSFVDADKDYSNFNALDVHIWMIQNKAFGDRTKYFESIHPFNDDQNWQAIYAEVMAVWNENKPEFTAWMDGRMAHVAEIGNKWGIAYGNTEGWGLINLCDHPYLDWELVRESGEICAAFGAKYGYAFNCSSNFTEPQFNLWDDIAWHRQVTDVIRSGENAAYRP
ncbi:MAG: cellulase-like family protein [Saccharofermentanales bacterium]|jgi:hypothetical protein